MQIQILVDNKKSWIMEYVPYMLKKLNELGHRAKLINDANQVKKGDILFLLSCEKIFKKLELNRKNIVIHASKLPKGKGFSPLTWQILDGENQIPMTLFEADSRVDSGGIYFQENIKLNGDELIDEIRKIMGEKIVEYVIRFVNNIDLLKPKGQRGEDTFYRKRTPSDSCLDINKSINEQFNLLRVVDNERYPAFFKKNNIKYVIKIYKEKK